MNHQDREALVARHAAAIVESSEDAISSEDLGGVIQSWNRAAERMFGYTRAEAIGQPIAMLLPPDRPEEEAAFHAKIARGERIERHETQRVHRNGSPLDVCLTISPLRDASGQVVGASRIAEDLAARRKSEEWLARFAAIVESSDDAIVSKNLQGVIQSWNPGAERILGYSAAEAVGQSITLIIPRERRGEEREILAKIARGERVHHYETVRVTKAGRPIEVSLTISPVRNAAGVVIGASKVLRDVTERKRMERELAAQREWFRVTLASVGDAVIASDVGGSVTFVNGVATKLTGWSPEEASGRPLAEVFRIISEKTREPVENPAAKVIRSGATLGLANHTLLIHRDGSERPIADSAAPILDDQKRIIGTVLTFRDITEVRRAEDAIHEQREWFEQTLQGIGDGVIATDIRGRIVFMNPVAEYLTGRKLAECRGSACTDVFRIVNEHTRQTVENPVGRVLREGQIVGLANHTVLIDAEGNERCIDDSGAPIRNPAGRLVGAVLVFRDVSERRRAELERSAAAQERERLLDSERAARTEAERASRVKDDFVATLSHELRTPLNSILGWTQILRTQASRAEVIERGIDVIERNTRMQAQLVADLLDMSRIVSGKLSLEMHSADLAAIVDASIETIQPAAQAKGIALDARVDRSVGPMAGDPGRLQQVVSNLLANALKFTPAGGRIDVVLEKVNSEAVLHVRDTGIGIRADFLPSIFERFRQADSATNRRFGGLGLGLALVKQLVELHGGSVEARSEGEGHGSTFTVRLPTSEFRIRGEAEWRGSSRDAVHASLAPGSTQLSGVRILVVDDDEDAADLLRRLLQNAGAEVTAVASAAAALESMAHAVFEVLVSDVGMPEIDGYELIRRIRERGAGQGGAIPAVAVTAFARAEDRTRAMLAGYQAHLSKPIEAAELIATVRMLSGLTLARPPDR